MLYTRSFIIAIFIELSSFGASSPLLNLPVLETAQDLPYTWQYKGCYIDRVGNRALKRAAASDGDMTGGWCARWCSEQGFNLAGTEWGRECYCGYELNKPVLTMDADCSFPCAGWATEACGGSQRLTVYETLSGNPPSTNPGVPGFPSLGCYSDSVAKRALPIKADYEGGLDVAKCVAACSSQGFSLAGVEYGSECYCGNALDSTSRLIAGLGSASGCDYVCSGAQDEFCGGSNRMNLYGTLPAIIPTSIPLASSTSTPVPTTSTPSTTSATPPQPTSDMLPPTDVTSTIDTTTLQIPTSETLGPTASTSTPINDESTSSPTPTSALTTDILPVDTVVTTTV